MKHNRTFEYVFGIILIFVSLFMIFKNTYVSTLNFYSIGRVNTGAILVILLILSVVFAVVRPSRLSKILLVVILILMVVSRILEMHIGFRPVSVLDVILMVVPLGIGIGFVLKNLLKKG